MASFRGPAFWYDFAFFSGFPDFQLVSKKRIAAVDTPSHPLPQEPARWPPSLQIAETIPNEHECSYLADKIASLPLHLPTRRLSPGEFDFVLDQGIRRSGVFLYHTACQGCDACEPSRVDVSEFVLGDSHRRVLRRGDEKLQIRENIPSFDPERLRLFNLHKTVRELGSSGQEYGEDDYESFLVHSCCCDTVELSFWIGDALAAISIIDCGQNSLSAVYTYFDPAYSKLSLGTYSILKQFEFARLTGRQYVYLGMYVAQNQHLNYKGRFTPQERWIAGSWVHFS